MKAALLINLSFLLFAFTSTYLPLACAQEIEQVVDTNGNPIFPGGRYYILPALFGPAGGGVRPGNSTCPVPVLQALSEVDKGQPVKFSIPGISPGIIFTETPLDISFEENKPECAESSKWVVVSDDFPREWVGIGGVEGQQGKQILSGRFRIQKYGDFIQGYKFVFCPIINAPPGACFDVGRSEYDKDENGRRLIRADVGDPYQVVFLDADATGSSIA